MHSIPTIQELALVSELQRLGLDDRPFRRAVLRGDVVRVHRGAYMDAAVWRSLTKREQYRHQVIAAVCASRSHPVLSHVSAAVVWGVPLIGALPRLVHVLATESAGTRTEGGFRRHATAFIDDEIVTVDGVAVTSLRRTLVDLAVSMPFSAGVVALDWALAERRDDAAAPGVRLADVEECARHLGVRRGAKRLRRALDFATPLSGSPGESLSRAVIHELGFPPPVLQQRFDDRGGLIGFTDFWWPEHSLIGEFDGLAKYTRDQYTAGKSIADVVIAEKKREDRLRALGPRVSRWLWAQVELPRGLFHVLRDAGLPTWRRDFR